MKYLKSITEMHITLEILQKCFRNDLEMSEPSEIS